ncbi:PA3496 family putative envelope integrity protein [Legionella sp.]|uniref:PA3496 family putative envelope integrity protein n=1 Tax=Legionella sp. TaxID=459 RepID=UPI003CC1B3CB
MSDLFEEDEEGTDVEIDDFDNVEDEIHDGSNIGETNCRDLDARRRLENMLDEKRLRDELDDFGDY